MGFALCNDWAMSSWISEEPSKWLCFSYENQGGRDGSSILSAVPGSGEETGKYNLQLWESFREDVKEMNLEAAYKVWVAIKSTKTGKISKEASLVEKDMCRVLNLLDVALDFCTAYSHEMSSESFFGLHKGAFRTLYSVALGVRCMVESAISKSSNFNEY